MSSDLTLTEAINQVYTETLKKYDFQRYETGLTESFIGFIKNELVIIFYLNPKIQYEIGFLEKGQPYDTRIGMINLINPHLPIFSPEKDKYLKSVWEKALEFGENTTGFYKSLIESDIRFIEKHYPQMLNKGQLRTFE